MVIANFLILCSSSFWNHTPVDEQKTAVDQSRKEHKKETIVNHYLQIIQCFYFLLVLISDIFMLIFRKGELFLFYFPIWWTNHRLLFVIALIAIIYFSLPTDFRIQFILQFLFI